MDPKTTVTAELPPEQHACKIPDLDEAAIRADERRRMQNAISWELSCLGCSDRQDALIAERNAGYLDALRDLERALTGLGDERALALVRDRIADRPRTVVEPLGAVPDGSGQGPPL